MNKKIVLNNGTNYSIKSKNKKLNSTFKDSKYAMEEERDP